MKQDYIFIVPPKIIGETQINMQAVLGDDIHLPCNVEGDPKPTIIWQKGTSILSGGAGEDSGFKTGDLRGRAQMRTWDWEGQGSLVV